LPQFFKKFLQFLFFLALGVGIMYWVFVTQDKSYQAYCRENGIGVDDCVLWRKMLHDLLEVKWIYIVIIFLSFYLSNYFRALRWLIILEPLGYHPHKINTIGSVLVSYFANLGIPRSGEFVRAALISKYEKIPLDKAFGTVVLDRMVDLISMAVIIFITTLTQLSTFRIFYEKYFSEVSLGQKLILPSIFLVFLVILYLTRNRWRNFLFFSNLKNRIRGFYEGLVVIKRIKQPRAFMLYTLLIWVWFYVMLYAALQSFEPTAHLSLIAGLVIYVFGSLGMLIPTPGGMGSYHYLIILVLAYYNINPVDAFSFANISFFCAQFADNVILGLAALLVMYIFNKRQKKAIISDQIENKIQTEV